mmetsp:Transcript_5460/g.11133  ORF Transcript_5460/g.11133 Transcript_5460/m.11133 type:complete len:136 (-) Transcript_5460:321-728(-)|eukprot:CAMPEP_0118920958 /NCGR_PEP_ID=MMETSP1169-20130426/367_1 /TAXON_ID=36882 /ORGANISM="Pyramimonas obovata, Strain CCMP722" /LENGTH=135 /DNA_ID=CAMNT_0006861585 /DNA_START=70 /DNA_END=477 /DNA_ORIENTATION=+
MNSICLTPATLAAPARLNAVKKNRTHNAVATRARAVRCVALSEDQNKVMRTAALVGGVSLAMLASQTPMAHAAQDVYQLAHEFELELENGPAPFWLYILLAVPGPTVAFLVLTDGFGKFGQRFPDGSSMPPEEDK